jgi:hypothetical protein
MPTHKKGRRKSPVAKVVSTPWNRGEDDQKSQGIVTPTSCDREEGASKPSEDTEVMDIELAQEEQVCLEDGELPSGLIPPVNSLANSPTRTTFSVNIPAARALGLRENINLQEDLEADVSQLVSSVNMDHGHPRHAAVPNSELAAVADLLRHEPYSHRILERRARHLYELHQEVSELHRAANAIIHSRHMQQLHGAPRMLAQAELFRLQRERLHLERVIELLQGGSPEV